MSPTTPIKVKCKTCPRYRSPNEIVADLCANCWHDRSQSMARLRVKEFSNGNHYLCYECRQPIYLGGYLTWVTDAKTFAFFCVPCSDKKHQKDAQYRNTKFAYERKLS